MNDIILSSLVRKYFKMSEQGECCPDGMSGLRFGLAESLMRSAVGRAPDSYVRGPGFDTQSGQILLFLLLLIEEGHLSASGESLCTKY